MEIVSNLLFSDRMYIPWERMLRVCLIFLLSGMLYLGMQTHMESVEKESRGNIVSTADVGSEKGLLRTEPVGFRKEAGNIAGILTRGDVGELEVLPIPFAANDTNVFKTMGKTEAPDVLWISVTNPDENEFKAVPPFRVTVEDFGDSGIKVPAPAIRETGVTAGGFRNSRVKAPAPVIEETKATAEDFQDSKEVTITPIDGEAGKTITDSGDIKDVTVTPVTGEAGKTITDSGENKTDIDTPSISITDESDIKIGDSNSSEIQTVAGGEDAGGTGVGADSTGAGANRTDVDVDGTDAGTDRTGTDVSGTDAGADDTDVDSDIRGTTIVSGFILDEEGYITGTESDVDMTDGILVFPTESGCVGIREGALSGLSEYVFEIYIPANIRDIEPGVFKEFTSFLYIEAAEDNPGYYSMDGSLYSVSGEEIFVPCEE